MNCKNSGNSLIGVLFFLIVLGLITQPVLTYYHQWQKQKAETETLERAEDVNKAILNYVTVHGRYPCPAPLDAVFDTATFGKEASGDCTTGSHPGTTESKGYQDGPVLAGAVPVRTLGLGDEYTYDGYKNRFVYTMSAAFGAPDPDLTNLYGSIMLVDEDGDKATQTEGNIIFAVMSMGEDTNGVYSHDGVRKSTCDTTVLSGENCNLDATLRNTAAKSYADDRNKLTQLVRFEAARPCENQLTGKPAKKMAYLLDTSGSMQSGTKCPPGYGSGCTRMDAAHWALRRAVSSRQLQTKDDTESSTDFTGFVGKPQNLVGANISVGATDNIEDKLKGSCPVGGTPLGDHMAALAEKLGDGEAGRPNSIMVVSDGESNQGSDPWAVAQEIAKKYPNLQINFVDIGNTPSLKRIAEITGGKYYQTSNPQDLLDSIMKLTGTCKNATVKDPPDQRNCR